MVFVFNFLRFWTMFTVLYCMCAKNKTVKRKKMYWQDKEKKRRKKRRQRRWRKRLVSVHINVCLCLCERERCPFSFELLYSIEFYKWSIKSCFCFMDNCWSWRGSRLRACWAFNFSRYSAADISKSKWNDFSFDLKEEKNKQVMKFT